MFISYLITALVVFSLIGSVVYAMWKCAQRIAFILSIFLFIILLFVVVKVFFNRENLSQLHSNIEKSQIDQITQNAVKESVKSAQSILHSTPVTAESPQAPEQALAVVSAPAVAPAPAPAPAVVSAPVVVPAPAAEPPQPAPIKKAEPPRKPAKKVEDNLIDLL